MRWPVGKSFGEGEPGRGSGERFETEMLKINRGSRIPGVRQHETPLFVKRVKLFDGYWLLVHGGEM
jgi:hypothetical protein